jgi:hypothetical protein
MRKVENRAHFSTVVCRGGAKDAKEGLLAAPGEVSERQLVKGRNDEEKKTLNEAGIPN